MWIKFDVMVIVFFYYELTYTEYDILSFYLVFGFAVFSLKKQNIHWIYRIFYYFKLYFMMSFNKKYDIF